MVSVSLAFLSTPSARRATSDGIAKNSSLLISIHALREEGDRVSTLVRGRGFISIHALREEGDIPPIASSVLHRQFLSTPSARRATSAVRVAILSCVFLSTPSARRATQPDGH